MMVLFNALFYASILFGKLPLPCSNSLMCRSMCNPAPVANIIAEIGIVSITVSWMALNCLHSNTAMDNFFGEFRGHICTSTKFGVPVSLIFA